MQLPPTAVSTQAGSIELAPDDQVQFVNYHRPRMRAGDYTLNTQQLVQTQENDRTGEINSAATQHFSVIAERFQLPPESIHTMYPAASSVGDFQRVLPHVMLNNSTLPWSRSPRGDVVDELQAPPWMGLLVFTQAQAPLLQSVPLSQLYAVNADARAGRWPGLVTEADSGAFSHAPLVREQGQHDDDVVNIIDVPWSLLKEQLPTFDDLRYMTHVRKVDYAKQAAKKNAGTNTESDAAQTNAAAAGEYAVLTANRLPPAGQNIVVHLVSLEHRYRPDTPFDDGHQLFDFDSAAPSAQLTALRELLQQARSSLQQQISGQWLQTPQISCQFDSATSDSSTPDIDTSAPYLNTPQPLNLDGLDSFAGKPALTPDDFQVAQIGAWRAASAGRTISVDISGIGVTTVRAFDEWVRNAKGMLTANPVLEMTVPAIAAGGGETGDETLTGRIFEVIKAVQNSGNDVQLRFEAGKAPLIFSRTALVFSTDPAASGITYPDILTAAMNTEQRQQWTTKTKQHLEQDIRIQYDGIDEHYRLSYNREKTKSGTRWQLTLTPTQRLYFNHLGAATETDDVSLRLVSLFNWSFYSNATDVTGGSTEFIDLMQALNLNGDQSAELRLPYSAADADTPAGADSDGPDYLRDGYVPLPHRLRQGDSTISWYRGPLAPTQLDPHEYASLYLPARSADDLLLYNRAAAMFDVSYAAAWALGRSLALHDSEFAIALHTWKRTQASNLFRVEQSVDHDYLPLHHHDSSSAPLPDALQAWLDDLTLLKGVPFNYLVASEQLLPAESLRFFELDPLWIECLRDGAFSVGRVLAKDQHRDMALWEQLPRPARITGFLLRSTAVAHFNTMSVKGYAWDTYTLAGDNRWRDLSHLDGIAGCEALTPLRLERLASDVLLGLFISEAAPASGGGTSGAEVNLLEFHLPPEVLHFGVEEGLSGRIKKLRNPDTGALLERTVADTESVAEAQVLSVKFNKDVVSALEQNRQFSQAEIIAYCEGAGLSCSWENFTEETAIRADLVAILGGSSALVDQLIGVILSQPNRVVALSDIKELDGATEAQIFALLTSRLQSIEFISDESAGAAQKLRAVFKEPGDAQWSRLWRYSIKRINETIDLDSGSLWRDKEAQVLNMTEFYRAAQKHLQPVISDRAITAGDFALQMIDAAPLIRFSRFS